MNMPPSNILHGHERTVGLIQESILGSRSMPSWIFGGPLGVGKFTAARLLAGLLLDPETRPEDVTDFAPRTDTDSGTLFAAGTHPDLHVICKEQALESPIQKVRDQKQRTIPVAVLRQQIIGGVIDGHTFDAPAYMKPHRGTGKVFIIDEAELISEIGQNLLLKTLEEPPPRTWFILVTTRPDRLLPTIHSRCQSAQFNPLDQSAMSAWKQALEIEVAPAELDWAVGFSEGAPGLAVAAINEELHSWHQTFEGMIDDFAAGRFPAGMASEMERFIDESAVAAEKADRLTSKQAAGVRATKLLINLISSLMRSRMHTAIEAGSPGQEAWADAIEVLARSESQIESNVNRKLALAGLGSALADVLGLVES